MTVHEADFRHFGPPYGANRASSLRWSIRPETQLHGDPGSLQLGPQQQSGDGCISGAVLPLIPPPDKGLYIYSIEVLTPYAQLVNDAMTDMINENIYDMERKYASRAGVILVRVRVYSTPTSSLPFFEEGIWKEITIEASQKDVLKLGKKSLNHVYPGDDSGPFDYANLELQFDAKDVASAPLTIAVSTSDGQHVETKFDLDKLK